MPSAGFRRPVGGNVLAPSTFSPQVLRVREPISPRTQAASRIVREVACMVFEKELPPSFLRAEALEDAARRAETLPALVHLPSLLQDRSSLELFDHQFVTTNLISLPAINAGQCIQQAPLTISPSPPQEETPNESSTLCSSRKTSKVQAPPQAVSWPLFKENRWLWRNRVTNFVPADPCGYVAAEICNCPAIGPRITTHLSLPFV